MSRIFWLVAAACLPIQAHAADITQSGKTNFGDLTVAVHSGVMTGVSHEYVYNPDGSKLSELIWKMNANPVLNIDLNYDAGPRLALFAKGSVGLSGNNYMTDYDWLRTPAFTDWSDRSQHDDTRLNRYFSIDAGFEFDFYQREAMSLSLLGGAKYTEVKWTAHGGDFVYSGGGIRDMIGSFPDGEKGISYRQSLPLVYTGLGFDYAKDRWNFGFSLLAGATISASDRDNHFMRSLYFLEDFDVGAFLGANAKVAYALTETAELFVSGSYSNYLTMKGPTEIFDLTTDNFLQLISGDAAGTSLQSLQITAGMQVTF